MTDWLMKFGLGGVQRLIAESRKTNDLRVGSRLISDLLKCVGKLAQEEAGATLLRPSKVETEYWPHQIVLRFDAWEKQAVAESGKKLVEQLRAEVVRIGDAEGTLDSLPKSIKESMQPLNSDELAAQLRQIASSLEVYWVAVPIDVTKPAALKTASAHLFQLYDQRRHTRTFHDPGSSQIDDHESSRDEWPWICSLCGTRVAIIKPPGTNAWSENRLLNAREKLCALCAAKRVEREKRVECQAIRSTHALARDRFLRNRATDGLQPTVDDSVWARVLDQFDDLFKYERESDQLEKQRQRERFGRGVVEVFQTLSPDHRDWLRNLSPYYSILFFDGDHMGKWFSGAKFRQEINRNDDEYDSVQRRLSDELLAFAERVAQQASAFNSELIYAGGDEGLILAPLDFSLLWINQLNQAWQQIRECSAKCSRNREGMTLSLHASFVHAKSPLQTAIRGVHQGLADAKALCKRNCVSLRVCPRSGAPATAVMRWDEVGSFQSAVSLFSNWRAGDPEQREPDAGDIAGRNDESAPARLVYKTLAALPGFFDPERGKLGLRPEFLTRELLRIAQSESESNREQTSWRDLAEWLVRRGQQDKDQPQMHGLANVQGILKVVGWLARQLKW